GSLTGGATARSSPALLGHRAARHGRPRFALAHFLHRARHPRLTTRLPLALTSFVRILRAAARRFLHAAFLRRRKRNPRAPGLGKSDCNRLLWRLHAVLALSHMLDLFAHEFLSRSRRPLAFPQRAP